jgi:hypothetical protein
MGRTLPDNAIVPVHMTIRPGGSGDGGWLKRSKAGDSYALDCEFTVIEGEYTKQKFWTLMTCEGETDGQKIAGDITRSRLRAILESARGINPADESEAARNARQVNGFGDFDNVRFWALVGYEPADGQYKEKNFLKGAVTPDRKQWTKLDQAGSARPPTQLHAAAPAAPAAPAAAVAAPAQSRKPSWANT